MLIMPELAVGIILAVAEAIIIIVIGDAWDTAAITGVIMPILTALGIHELREVGYSKGKTTHHN